MIITSELTSTELKSTSIDLSIKVATMIDDKFDLSTDVILKSVGWNSSFAMHLVDGVHVLDVPKYEYIGYNHQFGSDMLVNTLLLFTDNNLKKLQATDEEVTMFGMMYPPMLKSITSSSWIENPTPEEITNEIRHRTMVLKTVIWVDLKIRNVKTVEVDYPWATHYYT